MIFLCLCILCLALCGGIRLLESPKYFEGDIILTPEEKLSIYKPKSGFASTNHRWPSHTIPYDLEPNIGNVQTALQGITAAINDYHRYTCLRFKRRTTESTYIAFVQEQGCAAPLGFHRGKNRISLEGSGCHQKGVVIHEIMHNLGFYHEQSRPDRDRYIKILWDNINPSNMKDNFLKRPSVDSMGSPYDYLSIMHYPKDGFAKKGTNTIETLDPSFLNRIGQRNGFTRLDTKQINKLYKCGESFVTHPPITAIKPVGCVDVHPRCSSYKRYCNQPAWQDFLRKDCKVTCNFCGQATASPTKPTATETTALKKTIAPTVRMTTVTSMTNKPGDCHDKLGKVCVGYYKGGYCKSTSLKNYMKENCRSTCGFCKSSCGVPSIQTSRVIAGHDAKPGAWPWMTAIYYNGMFNCGGSLVTSTLVVTAAHCVYKDKDPKNYYVYMGDHDRRTKDGNEQLATISKIVIHPTYHKDYRGNNDIALMFLSNAIALNNRAKTICLPEEDVPVDSTCYITGWGKIKHPGNAHDILQQARLKIINNKMCHDFNSKMLNGTRTVTPQMLCAGHGPKDRRTGCHGDSGGPFVCRSSDGTWKLQGVVSWGSFRCDTKDAYTVFVRVTKFRNWIKKYIT